LQTARKASAHKAGRPLLRLHALLINIQTFMHPHSHIYTVYKQLVKGTCERPKYYLYMRYAKIAVTDLQYYNSTIIYKSSKRWFLTAERLKFFSKIVTRRVIF